MDAHVRVSTRSTLQSLRLHGIGPATFTPTCRIDHWMGISVPPATESAMQNV